MADFPSPKSRFRRAAFAILEERLDHEVLPYFQKNRDVLSEFTQVAAQLNREFFYKRLQQRVKDNLNYLHKINTNSTPLVDEFGRSTYFYSNIGPYKILLYQPGTPTFFSSINEGSDLVAIHDNCQQNGPILGMSCGCFLADFITNLSSMYQRYCVKKLLDAHNFHPDIYERSLEECLKTFVDEDRDAHGRLLEMKHILLNIGGKHEVKSEHLELYFYAKDIEVYRGCLMETITPAQVTDLSDISDVDKSNIFDYRRNCSTYQQPEIHLQLSLSVSQRKLNFIKSTSWDIIREKILTKNGIFEDPNSSRYKIWNEIDSLENRIRELLETERTAGKYIGTRKPKHKKCPVM